jgi:glycine betaine catabolism B
MWSKIIDNIDNFLNQITMYRLVLYILIGLVCIAYILTLFNLLPYNPMAMLFSIGFILIISLISNTIFAKVFDAQTNIESVYITALILSLIVSPINSLSDLGFLFWAALLATASKYILAIGNKHLFNPAAIAVVLTSIGFNASASWWVGNLYMTIPVAIGTFLIVRKLKRQDLVYSFLFTASLLSIGFGIIKRTNILNTLNSIVFHSPLLFFTGIMLTEPLTSPSANTYQFIFGTLVGFLYVPDVHIGTLYFSPEQALILGNIFSYFVNPKQKFLLTLRDVIQTAPDMIDFIFSPNKKMLFIPGQYMEWTFSHNNPDNRGNRRYFTLASSPTESKLRIGVKFYPQSSSFKKAMISKLPSTIVATQLAGDFTLPKNPKEKCVFIAGGIGITPFRSMIKYLIDTNQKRDIILLYSNKDASEIVYRDVFDQAKSQLGIKVVYHITSESGHFNQNNLPQLVPDFQKRTFYISGPRTLVNTTEHLLQSLGVENKKIKTDFFPGFV